MQWLSYVTNMLAEMRALGLSIIVVDQTHSAVSPHVLRSTNIKVAHRTVAKEDREALAQGMLMNRAQEELLGRLLPGEAFLYSGQFYRPILISNALVNRKPLNASDDPTIAPDESSFQSWMDERDWYVDAVEERVRSLAEDCTDNLLQIGRWETVVAEHLEMLVSGDRDDPEFEGAADAMAREHSGVITALFNSCDKSRAEITTVEAILQRLLPTTAQAFQNENLRSRTQHWEAWLTEARTCLERLSLREYVSGNYMGRHLDTIWSQNNE